jgi:hypothetical protein
MAELSRYDELRRQREAQFARGGRKVSLGERAPMSSKMSSKPMSTAVSTAVSTKVVKDAAYWRERKRIQRARRAEAAHG